MFCKILYTSQYRLSLEDIFQLGHVLGYLSWNHMRLKDFFATFWGHKISYILSNSNFHISFMYLSDTDLWNFVMGWRGWGGVGGGEGVTLLQDDFTHLSPANFKVGRKLDICQKNHQIPCNQNLADLKRPERGSNRYDAKQYESRHEKTLT